MHTSGFFTRSVASPAICLKRSARSPPDGSVSASRMPSWISFSQSRRFSYISRR
jgi:hypothetical protein